MKCKDCGKSFTYLDTSCSWYARCDLLGTAQVVGYCHDGDGESMCNCSDQEPPDWDCDLGRDHQYCINHITKVAGVAERIIMNREIKFRAKHIHVMSGNEHLKGVWEYGYLCGGGYYIEPEMGIERLIDCDTVGQYIGIKDANGKGIFEGDIVQRDIFGEKVIGVIAWGDMVGAGFYLKVEQDSGIGFYPMGKGQSDDDDGDMCNDIILGNIHDNPELLKR